MARRGVGRYAKAHLEANALAQAYMALSVLHIKDSYAMEDDALTLEELTLERFLDELDRADAEGTRDELDQQLANMLAPILEQAFAPQEQQ